MKMKICVRCHKKILKEDDYIRLTDYIRGKQNREEFYHRSCFRDAQTTPAKKMALMLGARASRIMDRAEKVI